jgi:hypothetical protein
MPKDEAGALALGLRINAAIAENCPPCQQKKKSTVCGQPSVLRFTWPGSTEQVVCLDCGMRAQKLAEAMGFELELLDRAPS